MVHSPLQVQYQFISWFLAKTMGKQAHGEYQCK